MSASPRTARDVGTAQRVLLVEDNPGDAALVEAMLEEASPGAYVCSRAGRASDAVDALLSSVYDCVLLDLSLPDAYGLDALDQLRAAALDVPVVVLSGRRDEQLAIGAVQEGAQDYLIKGEVEARLLARSIAYAVERKRAEVELAHQALHDGLTGLPNRALLLDRLGQALARLGRSGTSVAVLFCDLDRFKVINDSLGHAAGDQLLTDVARRLEEVLRTGDTAARFGGDEFVVLCEDIEGERHAVLVAERIARRLSEPFLLGEDQVHVRVSVGIAVTDRPTARPESLVRDADAAMYRAKERGGALYEVFDTGMHRRAVRRLATETALHRALDREELRLHFQPQLEMASGRMTGVEALVRWQHPERGLVGPGEFIAAAEETGLIHRLGEWVMEEACRQTVAWQGRLTMSINLSPRQVLHPELVRSVGRIVRESGVDPRRLCFEITETAVLDDVDAATAVLEQLKALGASLAIDDFGTGYSSLKALQQFPFDVVKIDRSFVAGMAGSTQEAAIVAAVISLSQALGLRTVAEGIETVGHLEGLRTLGCDLGQGFYFGRPTPARYVVLEPG
ncbi:MAG: EAL domain-containing protein [Solirubrobacterales bacterium]|nr:EAL domain-containing protein [Solirubrobacterales bacterium]